MEIVEYSNSSVDGILRGVTQDGITLLNLLGFNLYVKMGKEDKILIPPSDITIRNLYYNSKNKRELIGISIQQPQYCGTINIPKPEENFFFIVPNDVKRSFPERSDLLTINSDQLDEIEVDYLIN